MHGIEKLTPPQEKALEILKKNPDKLRLVVCSNTGSGKTLIAEMALTRVEPGEKKALYLVPLKALADQVYTLLRAIFGELGYRVIMKVGDYDEKLRDNNWDIMVATYEKADSLIRNGLDTSSIGLLIVDEVHTLNSDRGAPLELVISMVKNSDADIVLLSATIGNPMELAEWINGELVYSEYRPVKLIEGYYHVGQVVFPNAPEHEFEIDSVAEGTSTGVAIEIAKKFIDEEKPVLVFANSRRTAESMAKKLAKNMPRTVDTSTISEFIESSYEREILEPLIRRGVAFHHGGLSLKARSYIELLFRAGDLKVVVATPTLAAGVNLPPYAVLVPVKRFNGRRMAPISVMEYKQMAGRAGRPGYSPVGLSIIYDADVNTAEAFINGKVEPIVPKLGEPKALRTHVNALSAMGLSEKISEILSETFTAFKGMIDSYEVRETIEWLQTHGFMGENMEPTLLGKITARMYIDPEAVKHFLDMVYREIPATDEEIIFTIAASPSLEIKPSATRKQREILEAEFEWLLEKWDPLEYDYPIHSTLKATAILLDWISEVDDDEIYRKWNIGPGDLMNLRDNAEWIAHALSAIANTQGYADLSRKLSEMELRIKNGVSRELLQLVKIKGVGRVRARILWDLGVRKPEDIATIPPQKLARLPKFGPKTVKQIYQQLGIHVNEEKIKIKKTITDYLG